jgi:PAS domain S-box-containing protein
VVVYPVNRQQSVICVTLTRAISESRTVEEIYDIALDALANGLGVERASILLFDPDGVMRFKAYRGLSATYRQAVEGHSPWTPDSRDPQPLIVGDVTTEPSLAQYLPTIQAEGIAAMAFIPLVISHRVIGKFMFYYREPRTLSADELQVAIMIASQVAFAVVRTRTEEQARRSEKRLRYVLDAAMMGTWDWDMTTDTVVWSGNLERIHGLPPGTFDGSFASYEREIHPDDRERVLASIHRALTEGVPHDVEYRVVAPDGTVRWCEGKGLVEFDEAGRAVRMSGVCMIITRRKEAELARLSAAEEASRLKDEFLATLSHELRTPLNAIVGWVQLLQGGGVSPDRLRQAMDVIERNTRLQAKLIEDILDVSRIISGKLVLERLPVSLPQVLDAVLEGAAPNAADKRIAITRHLPADLPIVDGDHRRLHQVFSNVLANAIKFTPDDGTIDVRGTVGADSVSIEIADTGAGIARDFLPHVFERFRQADSRVTRRHGGLGLGLAIAHHLVTEHGGEIRAHSEGVDRGTTITIRLPIGAPTSSVSAIGSETVPQAPDVDLTGAAVVVCDDQRDSRELLATLLQQRGAEVIHCESAAAALEVLSSRSVQMLIADIGMPDMDGFQLLERLRAAGVDTPAMAVTAYARPEDRRQALACGFTAYCAKPIDAVEFLNGVRATWAPVVQVPIA